MINVMVIEDRILTLNALKMQVLWEEHGLRPVGFFTNCMEAMEQLEELSPDVIISDIVMPQMDGLSFCEYINGLEKNIKIIIISAYSKFEYAKKGIQLGVFDFLEKPVDYTLLAERIVLAGNEKKHEEQVRKIYENNHGIYQESFFVKLLKDGNRTTPGKEEIERTLQLETEHMQFNCLMVAADSENAACPADDCAERICNMLSDYYKEQEFWGPYLIQKDIFCIVFGEKENFLMETLTEQLQSYLRMFETDNPGIHLNIGLGYWVDDICKLQISATAAEQALEYRFVFGTNQVFDISDYADKSLSDYTRFDYFEHQLKECLATADYWQISKTCKDMLVYMEKHRIEKSYLLFFITGFLSTQTNYMKPLEMENHSVLMKLNGMVYASELLFYFEEVLVSQCREIRKKTGQDTEATVNKIQKYIETNFTKASLSLGEIAEVFNMSPNYICRIYKEKTGSTLTGSINRLRILQAKKLLVETDRKIWEISDGLGYSSQYYFSMGFKKMTGYSPKDYRNLKMAED